MTDKTWVLHKNINKGQKSTENTFALYQAYIKSSHYWPLEGWCTGDRLIIRKF